MMQRLCAGWALTAISLSLGCARPHHTAVPKNIATSTTAGDTSPAVKPDLPRSIGLALRFDDQGLHVVVRASSIHAEELREWRLGDDAPKSGSLKVRDGGGHPLRHEQHESTVTVSSREDTVTFAYDIATPASGGAVHEDPRATILEQGQFRVSGETILALPVAFEKRSFALALDVDGRPKDAPVVGSSFGVGRAFVHRDVPRVTGNELRRSAFIGGAGGHAIFNAPEGHDEIAWIGYSAFDPRPMAAEVATFRTTLRDHFKWGDDGAQSIVISVDTRPKGHFRVQRRTAGLAIALAGTDPFDAALRLSVAHELVHAWIGDRLWVGDTRAGHEAETIWFHEGYARWVAREQLYRVGLLSPVEYAAEVNRLFSIVTTSPHAQRSLRELADNPKAGGVVPLLVARGALHATLVDARIRATSKGQASLDDVLRALLRDVEEKQRPIAEESWHQAIASAAGGAAVEREDFDAFVSGAGARRPALPEGALGDCFELQEMAYDIYDPGFDVTASRDAGKIVGVRADGPAAKAGARDGDVLLKIEEPSSSASSATSSGTASAAAIGTMKLDIERAAKKSTISYRASAGVKRGPGFKKRATLSEDACRKLALRK